MSVYSIAVDLGGTNLRIAAVSDEGKLLEKLTTGTEVKRGRDFVISEMCDAIQSLMVKYRSSGDLAGIGIGVPGIHRHGYGNDHAIAQPSGLGELPRARGDRAPAGHQGHPGERRQRRRHGREVAGRRPQYRSHGDVHAGHRRRRRHRDEWPLLAWHERYGRRVGPLQHRVRGTSLRLRQPRLSGAVCIGNGHRPHGARSDFQRQRAGPCRLRTRQCRVHLARHLPACRFKVILPRRRSTAQWDARWPSASAAWSTP